MHETSCAGCGSEPHALMGEHPWVAIMRQGAAFVARPVCARCHAHPERRTHHLKAHFFPVSQKRRALAHAGSSSIGG